MIAVDRINDCWKELAETDDKFFSNDRTSFLASLAFHLFLLVALGLVSQGKLIPEDVITVFVPADKPLERDLQDLEFSLDTEITLPAEPLPDVGKMVLGTVELAAPPPPGEIRFEPDQEAPDVVDVAGANDAVMELFSNHDSDVLLNDLVGIQGAIVDAHGDVGSVDRITREIISRLELSDVLVVWLMDASESLRPRREQIIQHFDRVYDEVDQLRDDPDDALLTSIAAFGERLVQTQAEATSDRGRIQSAVRAIAADASGVENVFSAIKATAIKYREIAQAGRKVMIIVVTDERGNDVPLLDESLALVQRYDMSVHVIGPIAPFGRDEVKVKWNDPETGRSHYLPVDLGPETSYVEQARLAVWSNGPGTDPVSSGFGPHGLSRIAYANGGLYLVSSSNSLPRADFDRLRLTRYRPDYGPRREYEQRTNRDPLRLAVLRTAQASNGSLKQPLQRTFLAWGIQFDIKNVRNDFLAQTIDVLDRGLIELGAVEKSRRSETRPRWQAHYDLLVGRLLANRVRCHSYALRLDEMFTEPKVPKDGTKNAWEVTAPQNPEAAEAALPAERRQDADLARRYLQRVIDEHPGTPWATIAASELEFPLTFEWQETFTEPPEGVPLPWDKIPWDELTEAQKVAKTTFEKQQKQRRKRREDAAAEVEQRPPPKL